MAGNNLFLSYLSKILLLPAIIPVTKKPHRTSSMINCKNCNYEVSENFCANCGQAAKLKRIDKHYISHEVLHLLHFEKGFLYTAKQLVSRPGSSIREYISENRTRHMKPVAFLILTSLLYTLIAHLTHADKIYIEKEKIVFDKSSVGAIMGWVQTHYGYANIIMGFFIALCVQLVFRKYRYNFYETTVLLCFIMGEGMLLLSIEALFVGLLNAQIYKLLLTAIALAYPTWAIGNFFDKAKISSYIKAFFSYVLGYFLFYLAVILIGLTADAIMKML